MQELLLGVLLFCNFIRLTKGENTLNLCTFHGRNLLILVPSYVKHFHISMVAITKIFNYALIAKWKWRLGVEEDGLWKEVLESIYGSLKNLNVDLTNRKCSI